MSTAQASLSVTRRIHKNRHRVVVLLPRGEAIRNFVYSGALEQLSEDVDVTALSVVASESVLQYLRHCPYRVEDLETYPERYPVRLVREILDMAHGRTLWSKAAQDRWMLRDHEVKHTADRVKRLVKKALALPFASPRGVRALSTMERRVSRCLRTTDRYVVLFKSMSPSLVFNGSHVHSTNAIQAVEAAQWLGIPTAAFLFSWDNLTSQGRIVPAYDYYLVWNEIIRDQLLQIYPELKPEQVSVTGTPQFDFHFRSEFYWSRAEFCSRIGADPDRPIVLYSTGMPNHMPGEERIIEQLSDSLAEMQRFRTPQLVVRVYPKDRTGRFDDLKQRRSDILFPEIPWDAAYHTPRFEDAPLLTNMLRHCDCGINVASTISLELCMFDRPVINVAYDPPQMHLGIHSYAKFYEFDHYAPVVASGAVEVAKSPEELTRMIIGALQEPKRLGDKRRGLLETFFGGRLDGACGQRVADTLGRLAKLRDQQRWN